MDRSTLMINTGYKCHDRDNDAYCGTQLITLPKKRIYKQRNF